MPKNPYDSEYGNTTAALMNYNGDLDDLVLDTDDFDNTEEYASNQSDKVYHTLDNYDFTNQSIDQDDLQDLNFDEASEQLTEDSTKDKFDNYIDHMVDRVVARINPQRINAIAYGSDEFNVPKISESVNSLSDYMKIIEESFNNHINRKLEEYSK